ncbi:MAG TPA: hypothetical protein VIU11_09485, partial [Nakamurella sp.]
RPVRCWSAATPFNHVFDFPGADPAVPLFAFVFLVALGIDYSIFLMTRARGGGRLPRTLRRVGAGPGGHRGGDHQCRHRAGRHVRRVIPILFLAQIAFIVAFGVLLDTMHLRGLGVFRRRLPGAVRIQFRPDTGSPLDKPPAGSRRTT